MSARRRRFATTLAALLCAGGVVVSQQSPSPEAPASAARGARITFLPPPIEGTLSLGIYDRGGKLVRVLHREADVDEFEIGSDSLSTTWDGRNDGGESMPAGKYHARGFAIGDVGVEGVGYFFNDWVTSDDSPRVVKVSALKAEDRGFAAAALLASGRSVALICDEKGALTGTRDTGVAESPCAKAAGLAGVVDPIDCDSGKEQTLWVIDRLTKGSQHAEVKQFSSSGELLRRLAISADDPQPTRIAASPKEDRVFLLEENEAMQRMRGLALVGTKDDAGQTVSDWRVEFEKKIVPHSDFTVVAGKPVATARGGDAVESIKVRLQANALQDDKSTQVELIAAFDGDGAVLKTADGLPLQTISETPGLKRVVIAANGDKSLDLFQDDGAVVEQFRVRDLDRMMAFDCGDFELK